MNDGWNIVKTAEGRIIDERMWEEAESQMDPEVIARMPRGLATRQDLWDAYCRMHRIVHGRDFPPAAPGSGLYKAEFLRRVPGPLCTPSGPDMAVYRADEPLLASDECPLCGGVDHGRSPRLRRDRGDGNLIVEDWRCPTCGAAGIRVFNLLCTRTFHGWDEPDDVLWFADDPSVSAGDCPECSADLRGRVPSLAKDGDDVVESWWCPECESEGTRIYDLAYVTVAEPGIFADRLHAPEGE